MVKSSKSSKDDGYNANRIRFYAPAIIIDAFDKLCELDGKSRSEVLTQLVKARIRSRAKVLRNAGKVIPQEVFA